MIRLDHPIVKDLRYITREAIFNQMSLNTCSKWAVARRTMEDGSRYSISDYPYVKDILDSNAQKNWVMKAAQVGLSEAAITMALYHTEFHNRPVIYYFPTQKMADTFSKTRFSNAIELSDYLRSVVTVDTTSMKKFGTAELYIMGANSEASLRGTSSGRLFLDELDAWTERQQYMAEERMSGQKGGDKRVWGFSTPRFPGRGVHKQYEQSTQEHFRFICPCCFERIELNWPDNVEAFGDTVDDPAVKKSYLKCNLCQSPLPHKEKPSWLKTGRWEATNPDADPAIARGFHISQLYSPTVEPWEIVVAYLRGNIDEAGRQEFHNSKLGLPYLADMAQINDAHLDASMRKYSLQNTTLPFREKGYLVTLGIDQGAFHNWVAVAWKFDAKRSGDPNDRAIGRVVGCGKILQDDWSSIHALMRSYQAMRCVIDYHPDPTSARQFARAFRGAVLLCQYVQGQAAREVRVSEDEYGADIVRVDRTAWLSASLGRVMRGDLELPLDVPLEFRSHLKALVRSYQRDANDQPKAIFTNDGPDHYAHALTYAEIALKILDPGLNSSTILTSIH